MMMRTKSDSDVTSTLSPISSSPSSPNNNNNKRVVYYVQSPSRDSHDEDKSSSTQATPISNSPMDSPSHSRVSSSSRFSSTIRSKLNRKRNNNYHHHHLHKGGGNWLECNVIEEEGLYDDLDDDDYYDKGFILRLQIYGGLFIFLLLFTLFSLIIWGASRPYYPRIFVKSLSVNNFYFGEGSDFTGVPTRMMTVNCSLKLSVHNPATFFGIHVSSTPVKLLFSKLTVATGQLEKYYQPGKSQRTISIAIEGASVPLYGAGASLAQSDNNGVGVPLKIEFGIHTRGNLVGKLVKSRHKKLVTCPVVITSSNTKPIKFKANSCTYE